jgi:LssY C-terminus
MKRVLIWVLAVLATYGLVAYVIVPRMWQRYEERHPAFANAEKITHTGAGIPGDPVNLGLVGSETEIQGAMLAAKWHPADPITLASSIRIAVDVVVNRSYASAPVSNLYLFGRKEDLAFEQAIGSDPTRRHHVRFWRSQEVDANGEPLWFGAATLDQSVGLSHTTGQITHHISPDVDAERDKVIADLERAGDLASVSWIDGFHKELEGKNGGGDPWRTDGRLAVGVIEMK